MSGLYDDLAEVSRVKKEVVNPSSLYADLTVGPESKQFEVSTLENVFSRIFD
jgi:hypothetical protein